MPRSAELQNEARLAGAGLPHHRHGMAPTGLHLGQQIGQSVQLTLTAHEEAQAAAGRLQAAAARASSDELVDDEGLHPAPDRDRSPGLELNVVDRQTRGRVAHEDTPRLSQLLQAGGEMRNVADGGVVLPEVVANGTDDHEAGMHPHPEAQAHVTAGRQGQCVGLDGASDIERGQDGPPRMVLMRDRRAE